MNILETVNKLGKKAKDASIKIRVLQKEKKICRIICIQNDFYTFEIASRMFISIYTL